MAPIEIVYNDMTTPTFAIYAKMHKRAYNLTSNIVITSKLLKIMFDQLQCCIPGPFCVSFEQFVDSVLPSC